MKGILKTGAALLSLMMVVACGDDEAPKEDNIIGSWILDSYKYTQMPDGYTERYGDWETTSYFGYGDQEILEMTIEAESYSRSLSFVNDPIYGSATFSESGEWEINDGFLNLDPTGQGIGIANNFEILTNADKDLVLKAEVSDFLFHDTTTQEYYNFVISMADSTSANYDTVKFEERFNELLQLVIFDLEFDFDIQK